MIEVAALFFVCILVYTLPVHKDALNVYICLLLINQKGKKKKEKKGERVKKEKKGKDKRW